MVWVHRKFSPLSAATIFLLSFATFLVNSGMASPAFAQATVTGASGQPIPRFVSLKRNKVRMRLGPGKKFGVAWVYRKHGLPVEIIQEYDNWRKVRDPDGNEGWIAGSLLSSQRSAVIAPWENDLEAGRIPLMKSERESAASVAILEPGVVGEVRSCGEAWCRMDVKGPGNKNITGFIKKNALWGVYPDERFE